MFREMHLLLHFVFSHVIICDIGIKYINKGVIYILDDVLFVMYFNDYTFKKISSGTLILETDFSKHGLWS